MFYWPSVSLERSGRNCRVSVFYVTRQWRGEEKVDNQEAEATAVSQLFRSSHNDFRRMEKMNAKIELRSIWNLVYQTIKIFKQSFQICAQVY